jgi:hypothetical protein
MGGCRTRPCPGTGRRRSRTGPAAEKESPAPSGVVVIRSPHAVSPATRRVRHPSDPRPPSPVPSDQRSSGSRGQLHPGFPRRTKEASHPAPKRHKNRSDANLASAVVQVTPASPRGRETRMCPSIRQAADCWGRQGRPRTRPRARR